MTATPFARQLLAWYAAQARALPWRVRPGSATLQQPYRAWIAEVMLQQTTVAAARPRYQRFMARFPDVTTLASACSEDVLEEWAGLGYYARARNLHRAAQMIAEAGSFPETEAGLRQLPGMGDYTAAAVAAIAFGERTLPVDANILRVGARLFAIALPPARARRAVRAQLMPHVPADAPGDFAQALMDLGSSYCSPRAPDCAQCPVGAHCAAAALGTPLAFPEAAPRAVRETRSGTVWWLRQADQVALIRRPPTGLLGGMLGLPGTDWHVGGATDAPPAVTGEVSLLPIRVRHIFTHFTLELGIVSIRPARPLARLGSSDLLWTPADTLERAGLPGLYLKCARAALAAGG